MKKWFRRTGVVLLLVLPAWLGFLGYEIARFGAVHTDRGGDAAVVLGAAVWGKQPSPVFRERIRHAIWLYKRGRVRKIIFTGGKQGGKAYTEAEVAKGYALQHGVAAADILVETVSTTTLENLLQARKLVKKYRIGSMLLVSDPLHMKRAARMAKDLKLVVYPAPTPTTRYKGGFKKFKFLLRELYFYQRYLLVGR